MIFSWSAEVFKDAGAGIARCGKAVDAYLKMALDRFSILSALPIKVRYVPIVMPDVLLHRYPARSRVRKKERLYDCAPQLGYEVFVSGPFEEQLKEYVRGLTEAALHLAQLGASAEQIAEFERILGRGADEILISDMGQTRH